MSSTATDELATASTQDALRYLFKWVEHRKNCSVHRTISQECACGRDDAVRLAIEWRTRANSEIAAAQTTQQTLREGGCRCDPPGSGEEFCTGHCKLRDERDDAVRLAQSYLGECSEERARCARAEDQLDEARAENERLKDALHADKTGLAAAIQEMIRLASARCWIVDGRGSYEWDDDRYRREAGRALHEVIEYGRRALKTSGDLAHGEDGCRTKRFVLISELVAANAESARLRALHERHCCLEHCVEKEGA